MKKRFVSLLLAIGMILSLMPVSAVTAFAESENGGEVSGYCGADNDGKNLKWTLDSGVLTISGSGAMKNYNYYNSPGWYQHTNEITSVVFNDGITRIGDLAFDGCTNIKKVSYTGYAGTANNALPESVTKIGYGAFRDAGVTGTLELPKNLTAIGVYAFYRCKNLTGSLTIPENVTEIGYYTFSGCSGLTGPLTIPEGVKTIGESAFNGCKSLTGDLKIPDTVTAIGKDAFYKCSGFQGKLSLSNSLSEICSGTFWGCSGLTGTLTIPENVTKIGSCAFRECEHLTGDLNIPDTVTEVGGYAFEGCSDFDGTIHISNQMTKIEQGTFMNCSSLMGTLAIPEGVTTIDNESFSNCSRLTGTLVIPDSVTKIYGGGYDSTKIWDGAFEDCKGFTALQLSNRLTRIPEYAFDGCSGLTGTLTIPESVTEIGYYAFQGCKNLKGTLTIPNQVKKIGKGAFAGCTGLTGNLTIPENVTTIDKNAFYDCGFTESVDLSQAKNLTVIDEGTFEGCENLKKVYLSKHITSIGQNAFERMGKAKIYYPDYKKAWLELADHVSDLNDDKNAFISDYDGTDPMPVCYYCDVTFDPKGGTFADNTEAKTYQKIYRTELVETNKANTPVPGKPTRTGYTFEGWYYLDATQQKVTFNPATDGVPDTMTLYADWTQTGTTAAVAISGIAAEQELIKDKEYPFMVTVTPNDDTGAGKLEFKLPQNAELWYKKDTAGQWEKVDNSTLNINFTTTEYQFKLVPKESGANTLTVGVQKDGMTTGAANKDRVSFNVRDPKAAEIAIADLNNQTIKQNKPHTFTVTVTTNDDSGDMTVKFDSVKGLIYNDAPVTAGGITIEGLTAGETRTLNLIITPDEAGNGKTLKATLNNDATDTATYNVSAYEHANVTIEGLDSGVKQGESKEFTVKIDPKDDSDKGPGKLGFGNKNEEIEWKNPNPADPSNPWEKIPADGLTVNFNSSQNYELRITPKTDGEQSLTATVTDNNGNKLAECQKNYTVAAYVNAAISFADLNNQTIKQNKPHTFTVTVTTNDDSGDMTVKFDSVEGLSYNDAPVTDEGIAIKGLTAGETKTLNLIITPAEAGNGKTLKATLNNAVDATATYNVSAYEHANVTIEGLDSGVKQGESKDFTVKVDPKDDSGNATIDFGNKNSEIQYKNGEDWKSMPSGGLEINLSNGEKTYDFRITPKNDGSQTLTATVKQNDNELGKVEQTYTVAKKDEPITPGGGENPGENPGGGSTGDSGNTKPTPKPDEKPDRKIKIDGGIVEVNGKEVKPDEDGNITVKKGDEITVTVDKSKISDAQVFDQWVIKPDSVLNEVDPKSEKISFTMPAEDVTIEAMTRDASIEDDGPGILGTGALIATGVVGSAALLYQGHMLGTELYLRYLLPHGAVIPQNRAELAVLLWQDAESPEPVSTTLYSDISDEDSAIQQAARWAVENDLMEQLDADEHPDHFDPFVPVTFSDSIRAWKKAQELKKSVH